MPEPKQIVVVTGGSGFVGSAIARALGADPRYDCRACFRTDPGPLPEGVTGFVTGDLAGSPDLAEVLSGASIVIHTAALTHDGAAPLEAFRAVNVAATEKLARSAASAGVRRLVYLSSIKVNGERTPIDRPFTEADPPAPEDAYGTTKWEAEQALRRVERETGLEVVALRPPLVYGPGVKGNLRRLLRLVASGLPLPLGAIRNKRSMIGLDNLVSATLTAMTHPAAAGRTFLVSDGEDVSTPALLRVLGEGLGRPARLWSPPVVLLRAAASVLGRGSDLDRLAGSLRVDASAVTDTLGWRPEVTVAAGLKAMAASFAD